MELIKDAPAGWSRGTAPVTEFMYANSGGSLFEIFKSNLYGACDHVVNIFWIKLRVLHFRMLMFVILIVIVV